jgi:hypothetical protein
MGPHGSHPLPLPQEHVAAILQANHRQLMHYGSHWTVERLGELKSPP